MAKRGHRKRKDRPRSRSRRGKQMGATVSVINDGDIDQAAKILSDQAEKHGVRWCPTFGGLE